MTNEHAESHPHVNYFGVFIALCVCTALSVAFDLAHFTPTLLVTAVLAVAFAKAMFVMTYFMHLKFEGAWKFVILMPTTILAIGLMIALAPDMALHYYTPEAPQAEYKAELGAGHGHGDAHGDEEHAEEHDSADHHDGH